MRLWLFARSYMIGAIAGSAIISHFTYKQVKTADFEVQYALEDLARLELDISSRGNDELATLISKVPQQLETKL